jgi:hypothetical protein
MPVATAVIATARVAVTRGCSFLAVRVGEMVLAGFTLFWRAACASTYGSLQHLALHKADRQPSQAHTTSQAPPSDVICRQLLLRRPVLLCWRLSHLCSRRRLRKWASSWVAFLVQPWMATSKDELLTCSS